MAESLLFSSNLTIVLHLVNGSARLVNPFGTATQLDQIGFIVSQELILRCVQNVLAKHLGHRLKRVTRRFWVNQIHREDFNGHPAHINKIVLPPQRAQANRVDELIEEQCSLCGEHPDAETHLAKPIRENLGGVETCHRSQTEVVSGVDDENKAK